MQVLFACQHLLVVFPCSHGHDGPSKGGTWGWTRTRGFSCTYDLASSRSLARRRPKYLQKLTCRCGHGHKDCVMQINGERVDVDVMPEMTIGDLKQKLKALQPSSDKVIRRITLVELLLEGKKQEEDELTLGQLGLSLDSNVLVLFTVNAVVAASKESSGRAAKELVAVYIPEEIDQIEHNAFQECSLLELVTMPSSVHQIGLEAFAGCMSLTRVTLPDSLKAIRASAFSGCTSLRILDDIPNSVTEIGDEAFKGCSSLVSVAIPEFLQMIGSEVFANCRSLRSVTFSDVTEIGRGAFSGCSSLQNLSLPDSLIDIGESAFFACASLATLWIPRQTASIGQKAFQLCSLLTSLSIPESVARIGPCAFSGCHSLKTLTIPNLQRLKTVFFATAPLWRM